MAARIVGLYALHRERDRSEIVSVKSWLAGLQKFL
jgi:hypothetical protein